MKLQDLNMRKTAFLFLVLLNGCGGGGGGGGTSPLVPSSPVPKAQVNFNEIESAKIFAANFTAAMLATPLPGQDKWTSYLMVPASGVVNGNCKVSGTYTVTNRNRSLIRSQGDSKSTTLTACESYEQFGTVIETGEESETTSSLIGDIGNTNAVGEITQSIISKVSSVYDETYKGIRYLSELNTSKTVSLTFGHDFKGTFSQQQDDEQWVFLNSKITSLGVTNNESTGFNFAILAECRSIGDNPTSCSKLSASFSGSSFLLGTFNATAVLDAAIVRDRSGNPLSGKLLIYQNGEKIELIFSTVGNVPFVKVTSANGSIQTLRYSDFIQFADFFV
jgi:hypothetical protein